MAWLLRGSIALLSLSAALAVQGPPRHQLPRAVSADVCIYGGTAVIVEPGQHLGGLSAGGLGATDTGNRGAIGGLSREFYRRVREHYLGAYGARANHWLHVTFSGIKGAALIGARVELSAGGRKQYRWIHSNHSYKSGDALDAHFGLGRETSADLTVTLLDGRSVEVAGVRADRSVTLDYPTGGIKER